ncbi:hypothetical protein BS50DRAFT_270300 [Corynespora cassiicola Philippines]|uniref:Uncharacterized protein n=1 Tax=Corynespora cassiicola Philippines TaxID=1448308 RepID=A0A2T2NZU5_CORCC|nr:hypothetical protein BS50DRAFT_270300 [Corynespora cassiicola Philippines]
MCHVSALAHTPPLLQSILSVSLLATPSLGPSRDSDVRNFLFFLVAPVPFLLSLGLRSTVPPGAAKSVSVGNAAGRAHRAGSALALGKQHSTAFYERAGKNCSGAAYARKIC